MKTVIMAGGQGTRISSVAKDIPKPMIKIEGVPVLEREIECLKNQGFNDIIITVSHLGNIIMDYFGDGTGISPVTGKPFGVHIEYYFEKEPLGNAGALFKIKDKLTSDFLLLNADAIFDVDFNRFVNFHQRHGGLVAEPFLWKLCIANIFIVSSPHSQKLLHTVHRFYPTYTLLPHASWLSDPFLLFHLRSLDQLYQ